MSPKLTGPLRRTAYQSGQRGMLVAGSYLALVFGVAIYVSVTELLTPSDDANLAGVWLFLITAPTAVFWVFTPSSWFWGVDIAMLVLGGLFQAYLVWLLFRGRPVERVGSHLANGW